MANKTRTNLTRAQRRRLAVAEHREALKEFRRYSHNNETAGYLRAHDRLEAAERALAWWRR
jgi:hypothetical protein